MLTQYGEYPIHRSLARQYIPPPRAARRRSFIRALVCTSTNPSWASVLSLAAAAVIEMGGRFSHGAIVARELGIPCVINAREASRSLRTGDLMRADGAAGIVELVAAASAE